MRFTPQTWTRRVQVRRSPGQLVEPAVREILGTCVVCILSVCGPKRARPRGSFECLPPPVPHVLVWPSRRAASFPYFYLHAELTNGVGRRFLTSHQLPLPPLGLMRSAKRPHRYVGRAGEASTEFFFAPALAKHRNNGYCLVVVGKLPHSLTSGWCFLGWCRSI